MKPDAGDTKQAELFGIALAALVFLAATVLPAAAEKC